MTPLAYLIRLCRRWGGSFETMLHAEFHNLAHDHRGWSCHPSCCHAISVDDRRIIAIAGKEHPGAVIHEMGHVFLREGHPAKTHEPNWLGWEIALARRARCYRAWSDQNCGYNFRWRGEEREWGALERGEERQVVADFVAKAIKRRIVTPSGTPLCTRTL
jgi:hypothetical protein